MNTKRFFAKDMRQAIREIARDLGPEAVILSNTKLSNGIEVVATAEYDDDIFKDQFSNPNDPYNYNNIQKRRLDTRADVIAPTESDTKAAADLIPDTKSVNNDSYIQADVAETFNTHTPSALQDIQTELNGLRNLVKEQLTGLAWGETARRHPLRMKLLRHLMELGLSQNLCKVISDQVPDDLNLTSAWEKAIKLLISKVPEVHEDILENNHVVTFVGPTGVGKTTSIAKLAARYALKHGRDKIALVTTDCYRIGAQEQLKTYAKILDIPLYLVSNEQELKETMNVVKDRDLVLVDFAGMSLRDERLEKQLGMLDQMSSKLTKTILVLSAATQYQSQAETIKTFLNKVDACIITKIDEAANLGAVLSNVVESQLAIAYTCDGQHVPEDIHDVDSKDIVDRCVSLMREMDGMEETFEKLIWGRSVNANV